MKRSVSVLLMQDETGSWVAQCLEHDMAAQGDTINEALAELTNLFHGELVVNETLDNISPAPKYYWDKYCRSMVLESSRQPVFQPETQPQSDGVPPAPMLPKFRELRVV